MEPEELPPSLNPCLPSLAVALPSTGRRATMADGRRGSWRPSLVRGVLSPMEMQEMASKKGTEGDSEENHAAGLGES
jgi:hypothetical protein